MQVQVQVQVEVVVVAAVEAFGNSSSAPLAVDAEIFASFRGIAERRACQTDAVMVG